jgi:hypothetical protein
MNIASFGNRLWKILEELKKSRDIEPNATHHSIELFSELTEKSQNVILIIISKS